MNVTPVDPAIRRGPLGSASVVTPLPGVRRGVGPGSGWSLIVLMAALSSTGCANGTQRQYQLGQAGPPRTIALVGDRPLSITAGEPGRSIASTDRPNRFRLAGFPIGGGGSRSNDVNTLNRDDSGGSGARAGTPRTGGSNVRRIGSSIEFGSPRGPVEVSGRVVSTTGRPVERVRVRVARLDDPNEAPRIIETDSQGRFTAKELTRDGEYSFVAELTTPEGRLTGRVVALAPEPYVRIVLVEPDAFLDDRSASESVAASRPNRPASSSSSARTRRASDSDRSAVRIRAGSPDYDADLEDVRTNASGEGDWRDGTVRDDMNPTASRNRSRGRGWGGMDDEGPNPLPPAIERPRGTSLAPAEGFREDALDSGGGMRNDAFRSSEGGGNESDWRTESEWGLRVQAIDWNDLREPLRWSGRERRPRPEDLNGPERWSERRDDRPVPTVFDNPPPPPPLDGPSRLKRFGVGEGDPFTRSNPNPDEFEPRSSRSIFDGLEQPGAGEDRRVPSSWPNEPSTPPTRWGDLDWSSARSTNRSGSGVRSPGSSPPASRPSGSVARARRVVDRVAPRDDRVALANASTPTPRRLFDLSLSDLQGNPIPLATLVDEGSDYVLIDFFGTWCDPCRVTIPRLVDWETRFAGRLSVVGVAYERGGRDQAAANVERAARLLGIRYPLALGRTGETPVGQAPSCPLARWFEVERFPTLVLLDRQGRVIWKGEGGRAETLDELDRVFGTLMK